VEGRDEGVVGCCGGVGRDEGVVGWCEGGLGGVTVL